MTWLHSKSFYLKWDYWTISLLKHLIHTSISSITFWIQFFQIFATIVSLWLNREIHLRSRITARWHSKHKVLLQLAIVSSSLHKSAFCSISAFVLISNKLFPILNKQKKKISDLEVIPCLLHVFEYFYHSITISQLENHGIFIFPIRIQVHCLCIPKGYKHQRD